MLYPRLVVQCFLLGDAMCHDYVLCVLCTVAIVVISKKHLTHCSPYPAVLLVT